MSNHYDVFGDFVINPPLSKEHLAYLNDFVYTRRMLRNADVAGGFNDPVREAVGLPIGTDGCFYVGSAEDPEVSFGQREDESVVDYNKQPAGQPSGFCPWCFEDEKTLGIDPDSEAEMFISWMKYLINTFLAPWGYTVTGVCSYAGEEEGLVRVRNNHVFDVPYMPGEEVEIVADTDSVLDAFPLSEEDEALVFDETLKAETAFGFYYIFLQGYDFRDDSNPEQLWGCSLVTDLGVAQMHADHLPTKEDAKRICYFDFRARKGL